MGIRKDVYIYNESRGFVITCKSVAARASRKSKRENWGRLLAQGSLIALELYQDGPFVVRIVVDEPLTSEEESLWIDRVGAKLHLPKAGLALCGGRDYVDDPQDEDNEAVEIVPVPAGTYAALVHCYWTGPGWLRGRDRLQEPEEAEAGRYVDFVVHLSAWEDGFECAPRDAEGWIACRPPSRIPDRPLIGLPTSGLKIPADSTEEDEAIPPPGREAIRIIAVPPGDAPEWVRQAWVGLELPLAPDAPKGKAVVYSHEAIAVLAKANPKAAAWWKTNFPRACRALGITFEFPPESCARVERG